MKKNNFYDENSNNGSLKNGIVNKIIFFIIKYIAPIVIVLIFINQMFLS